MCGKLHDIFWRVTRYFLYSSQMSAKQNQDKLDKRAEALRDNLRKRQSVKKPAKKTAKKTDKDGKEDE
jgi:hypothetical protein